MKMNVLTKKKPPIVAHLALTRPRERGAEVAVSDRGFERNQGSLTRRCFRFRAASREIAHIVFYPVQLSRPPLIHQRGRTHTMLAATARRSSSVLRGAARVTGTRYFAVRLAADPHATPRAALERVAPRLNVSFARDGLDIRDDGARARDDDVASDGDAPDEPRPRLASERTGRVARPNTPRTPRTRASLTSTPTPPDPSVVSPRNSVFHDASASSPFSHSFVSAPSRLPGCLQRG